MNYGKAKSVHTLLWRWVRPFGEILQLLDGRSPATDRQGRHIRFHRDAGLYCGDIDASVTSLLTKRTQRIRVTQCCLEESFGSESQVAQQGRSLLPRSVPLHWPIGLANGPSADAAVGE